MEDNEKALKSMLEIYRKTDEVILRFYPVGEIRERLIALAADEGEIIELMRRERL